MHQVEGIKELRLKRAGPFMLGVFEVAVDGGMTVGKMHAVVTELENSEIGSWDEEVSP
ncbi:hypothetical protein E6H27_07230 [Candidatus Bathyarchaeota archaeon]|nr:MAG: hypothetical protein E6H27_07230 [Candidatus Bathyarchaeota archaeon]TMI60198.1 MAG: hypothetical protein E6H14_01285 [Candidatus Bathyarchaeota archaeon]